MDKKIKTGIIGYGLSGKAFHAPFLHTHQGFEITKIVERNKSESKEIFPYVEVVKDFKDLLRDQDIELIVHCTPNTLHYSMVKECLQAGKHVVIEKPFTTTSAEADELISISEQTGKKIFVYQNRRWDGDFMTIQKLLAGDMLGNVEYYEAHFDRFSPEVKGDWRDEVLPGSGVLFDLGPHLIDQVLTLFGMPLSIKAEIESQRQNSAVDDYFKIEMEFEDKLARVTAGVLVEELGPRFIIHGSKGSFIKYGIDPQEEPLRNGVMPGGEGWGVDKQENWGLITIDYEDEDYDGRIETLPGNYMGFYNNVYDVLTNNKEIAVKPEEARNVIKIIEMAFESSKTGKIIRT